MKDSLMGLAVAMVASLGAPSAHAGETWGYCPGCTASYNGGSGYQGGSSSGGTRTVSVGYRDGGSGYGWLGGQFRSGTDTSNGYNGDSGGINTPHRSDWYAKLQAQRQWDDEQYRKFNQQNANNVRCGLSNAPAYCYRLMGPYPTEMRVVRY